MQNAMERQRESSYQERVGSQNADGAWNSYESLTDSKRVQTDEQLKVLAKSLLAFNFPTPQSSRPIGNVQNAAAARHSEPRSQLPWQKKTEPEPEDSRPRFTLPSFGSKDATKVEESQTAADLFQSAKARFSLPFGGDPEEEAPPVEPKSGFEQFVSNVGERLGVSGAVSHGDSKSEPNEPTEPFDPTPTKLQPFFDEGSEPEEESVPSEVNSDDTSDSDVEAITATAGTLVGAGVAGAAVGGVLADMAVGVTGAATSGELLVDAAAAGAVALGGAAVFAATRPDVAGDAARKVGSKVNDIADSYTELARVKAELAWLEQQEKVLNFLDPEDN